MKKDLKCPMCDSSDFKEENGYYVCRICGNKIPVESRLEDNPKGNKKFNAKRLIKFGLIYLVLGAVILLGIIIVELAVFGRVDFFGDYFFVSMISIILLICGFISLVTGVIVRRENKISAESQLEDNIKDNKKFYANLLIKLGSIFLGLGAVILLGIIIVGLAVYGKVYLFDGYPITQFLTAFSIALVMSGSVSFVAGLIIKHLKK